MSGIKALKKIQLGKEDVAAGTPAAATVIWRGLGSLADNREVTFPDETVGILGGTDRSIIAKIAAAISFDNVNATFEQLPYILSAGIVNTVTGVADGDSDGYVYTYTIPTTAQPTIKTYTIEGGDDQQAEEMEYAFVDSFKLTGRGGEGLILSANWLGRQVTNTTFTSLSVASVEDILFGNGALAIDNQGGTFGNTAVSSTLLDIDLDYKTGLTPIWTANYLYFDTAQNTGPEIVLTMTYLHNSSAVTEKTAWRNETVRKIQLKWTGSALTVGTGGSTYTTKTVIVNLPGKYEKFDAIADQDGNDIVKCTFKSRYNVSDATAGAFIVVTKNSSLT